MLQIDRLDTWRQLRSELDAEQSVGFVPTMGALHHGHAALLERSVRENDITVLSVFVNPTQFDQQDDLTHYPRTLEADRRMAESLGVDYLLVPLGPEMYPDGYTFKVTETVLSQELEGAHRTGHFDGVLTVVLKLLGLVRPRRAYFGEKDFQQLELVRDMAAAFFLDVQIVGCPTVREIDGLAASSRNSRLTGPERQRASTFPRLLGSPGPVEDIARQLESHGFRVDYVDEARGRRLGAVHLGEVRLIDNVPLENVALETTHDPMP